MTIREFFALPRWWNAVGVLLLLLGLFTAELVSFYTDSAIPAWMLIALPSAWLFILCPYLDSRLKRFSESEPPWSRHRKVLFRVWLPFILVAIPPAFYVIASIMHSVQSRSFELHDELRAPVIWIVPAALAAFAILFGRLLAARVRRTAREAGVCFKCAYSLAEIPHATRCPECGTAVES